MEGLLQKAIKFRKDIESAGSPTRTDGNRQVMDGFSDQDREDVAQAMEAALSLSKMQVDPQRFAIKPAKKGYALPLLVNAAAILVLLGGAFFFSWLFSIQGEAKASNSLSIGSNEGRLLETMRKEAAASIASKNREIVDIQSRLESLSQERQKLASGLETRLAQKESELKKKMEEELQKERTRLSASGLSELEVQKRIQAYQGQAEEKSRQNLLEYRAKMDLEVKALENDLGKREEEYRNLLENTRQDRSRLQKETQERTAALQAQINQKQLELDQAVSQADQRLKDARDEMSRLAEQKARTSGLDDQIQGWYKRLRQDLDAKQYDGAAKKLDLFNSFLDSDEFALSPELIQRRDSERFFVSLVRELVEFRKRDQKTQSILEDSWLVEKARTLGSRAQEALSQGNMTEAYRIYGEVLQVMPETAQAWMYLAARQKADDAVAYSQNTTGLATASSGSGGPNAGSPGMNLGTDQNLALVRTALEAPDWEEQKRKILAEARVGIEKELQNLGNTNRELQDKIKESNTRGESLDQEIRRLKEQLAASRSDLTKQGQELAATQASLEKQLQTAQAARSDWDRERSQLDVQLSLSQAELQASRSALNQGQALLASLQSELTDAKARIRELEVPSQVVVSPASPSPAPLAPEPVPTADPARMALEKEIQDLRLVYGQLETTLADRDAELAQTQADLRGTKELFAAAQARVDSLEKTDRVLWVALQDAWQGYASQVSLEDLQNGKASLQARLKLDAFLARPEMDKLFPGLYQHVKEYNRLFQDSGSKALVLGLIDTVYSAGSYETPQERKAFFKEQAKSSSDADYQELLGLLSDLIN